MSVALLNILKSLEWKVQDDSYGMVKHRGYAVLM